MKGEPQEDFDLQRPEGLFEGLHHTAFATAASAFILGIKSTRRCNGLQRNEEVKTREDQRHLDVPGSPAEEAGLEMFER